MSQTENDLLIYTLLRSEQRREVEEGVRKLTRQVQPLVYKFVPRNSGSSADAADLVQDVVVSVYQQIRKGAYTPLPNKPLEAYVRTIMRNQWYKVLRQRRHQNEEPLPPDGLAEEIPPDETDSERVENALNQLGKTCQQILKDYYLNSLPLSEIADELGKSYAAIKEQKYRCMQHLKSLLSTSTTSFKQSDL